MQKSPTRWRQSFLSARPSNRAHLGRLAWHALWLPFRVAGGVPTPAIPRRRPSPALDQAVGLPIVAQLDTLRRAVWRERIALVLCRTVWLALLPLIIWLLLRHFVDHPILLLPFPAIAVAILLLGLALIVLARPGRDEVAYDLDRALGLRAQLFTAQEEAQGAPLSGLRALQLAGATKALARADGAAALRRRPVRELIVVALAAVLAVALSFSEASGFGGVGAVVSDSAALTFDDQAAAGTEGLFVEETQYAPPPEGDVDDLGIQPGDPEGGALPDGGGEYAGEDGTQGGNTPSEENQDDLDTVADALEDTAATREVADNLQAGDYQSAAGSLRAAGRNAGQLSPQGRRDLANNLRGAAGKVADPTRSQQLNDAASALERGDGEGAQAALDAVANDIERAARAPETPGREGRTGTEAPGRGRTADSDRAGDRSTAGQGSSSGGSGTSSAPPGEERSGPTYGPGTAPLGADEKVVKLPQGSQRGATVRGSGGGDPTGGTADPGGASTGDGKLRQGQVGEVGAEINRVPADQRDAVERYFTPPSNNERRR